MLPVWGDTPSPWGQVASYPELRGKTAIVTGGNIGIGEAVARRLAAQGASMVVVGSRHATEAERVASEIRAARWRRIKLAELARVCRQGGVVAAYVWDYAGRMELMRHFWDAAVALDPAAVELDEGRRFPICQPGPLAALWRGAGLSNVEVRAIDVPTDFRDYWSPFLGGQAPAPGYAMSLDEERRVRLRERIRAGLPFGPDGSIHLIARAWMARGTREPPPPG